MRKFYISIIIILVLAAASFFGYNQFKESDNQKNNNSAEVYSAKKEKVLMSIDFGDGQKNNLQVDFTPKMNALDLLKEGAGQLGMEVRVKTYDFGSLVEAIGERENGQDSKYWIYYINEAPANEAADKREIFSIDIVEWRFEKSPF